MCMVCLCLQPGLTLHLDVMIASNSNGRFFESDLCRAHSHTDVDDSVSSGDRGNAGGKGQHFTCLGELNSIKICHSMRRSPSPLPAAAFPDTLLRHHCHYQQSRIVGARALSTHSHAAPHNKHTDDRRHTGHPR